MRRQLWKAIVAELRRLHNGRPARRQRFSDRRILEVFFFAVVQRLPIRHACDARNWPICLRGRPLPSPAAMSRRMRSPSVRALLDALERAVVRPPTGGGGGLANWIDSTPIPIGPTSTDPHAAFGHAGGVKANGYRLHLLLKGEGRVADWRLTPMNRDERAMARRMIRAAKASGYLVGDGNFDVNALHGECEARGDLRLVAPKRKGGFGRRKHRPGRYASAALLAPPRGPFATALLHGRVAIERFFGTLKSAGTGLTGLPPWVRTMPRVRPFVTAHLILDALRSRGAVTAT